MKNKFVKRSILMLMPIATWFVGALLGNSFYYLFENYN